MLKQLWGEGPEAPLMNEVGQKHRGKQMSNMNPLPGRCLNSHTENCIHHLRGSKILKTQAWIPGEQLLRLSPAEMVPPGVPRLTGV